MRVKQEEIKFFFGARKNHQLPDKYTIVPAVAMTASVFVAQVTSTSAVTERHLDGAQPQEKRRLEQALNLMEKEKRKRVTLLPGQRFMHLHKPHQQRHTSLSLNSYLSSTRKLPQPL